MSSMRRNVLSSCGALCALLVGTALRAELADEFVRSFGSLREMHHENKTGEVVKLGEFLPNENLYAVGALADLAGEITIIDGETYLAYPTDRDSVAIVRSKNADVGATLLVLSEVKSWRGVKSERAVPFEELDGLIAELVSAVGIPTGIRIPFLVEGPVEQLQWHVIDGRRLERGGSSHEDHQRAAVRLSVERAEVRLIGFYSESDQGVFTHVNSKTHVHCVLEEPQSSGHVDGVVLPAGTTVLFPAQLFQTVPEESR